MSPTIERTKAQVLGEKLEMATKLIFVPSSEREPDQPLDLHTEVFVSHRGVFLDIGQFAVYVAKFIKPKQRPLPIVYGWGIVTSCQMLRTQRALRRNWWHSASRSGRTLHPSRPTKRLEPLATTGRSVYPMQPHRLVCPNTKDLIMSSSSPTLASLLVVVLTVKAMEEKVNPKEADISRRRASRRGRASKAEAHREVWPMVTLRGAPIGFRATATHGTGTNSVAGTGAGPELLSDPH